MFVLFLLASQESLGLGHSQPLGLDGQVAGPCPTLLSALLHCCGVTFEDRV